MIRKILWWGAVAFAVYWVIKDPVQAAASGRALGQFLSGAARGLSTFVSHL